MLVTPFSFAQEVSKLDSGDTAWMLISTVLVLFMTIPGLVLFYGGMVRSKNILSIAMQCFAITGLVTILWFVYGYSLAFSTTGMSEGVINLHSFIGNVDNLFLNQLTRDSLTGTYPETVWIIFQLTFAILAPALIVGAFAERMKFSSMLVFMGVWFTLVYIPIAHMVWGGESALMHSWGVLDFAGGTVVHINSGVAGLVACLMLGKRKGYPSQSMAPHNLPFTLVGTAMLWVGWFGFNAGSAGAANGSAGMAMLVTQMATAAAALSWMFCEWMTHGKPSALGIASGAVAGLVAVTPAAGSCGPAGALVIGLISGIICFFSATTLKHKLGYDDSLDAFGIHGVGGIVGAILTGLFAAPFLGGAGLSDKVTGVFDQVWVQVLSVLLTIAYTAIATFIILFVINKVMGLRVSEESELIGLDLSCHEERAYNF
ncbi:ammonium transporter [Entomomonas moraniae]|uniref:Ammonium transporter n=1 Tax=Entomomonas moraniae TaxID=2213226 RepID=A0A3Q9JLF7_9GAMM|nr:ammonium transporter [Entomomonas moraniae]AZS52279.1 ammonium transporter [Entomomonas moraniae]